MKQKMPYSIIVNVLDKYEIRQVRDQDQDGFFVRSEPDEYGNSWYISNGYVLKEIYELLDNDQIKEKYPEYFI